MKLTWILPVVTIASQTDFFLNFVSLLFHPGAVYGFPKKGFIMTFCRDPILVSETTLESPLWLLKLLEKILFLLVSFLIPPGAVGGFPVNFTDEKQFWLLLKETWNI